MPLAKSAKKAKRANARVSRPAITGTRIRIQVGSTKKPSGLSKVKWVAPATPGGFSCRRGSGAAGAGRRPYLRLTLVDGQVSEIAHPHAQGGAPGHLGALEHDGCLGQLDALSLPHHPGLDGDRPDRDRPHQVDRQPDHLLGHEGGDVLDHSGQERGGSDPPNWWSGDQGPPLSGVGMKWSPSATKRARLVVSELVRAHPVSVSVDVGRAQTLMGLRR